MVKVSLSENTVYLSQLGKVIAISYINDETILVRALNNGEAACKVSLEVTDDSELLYLLNKLYDLVYDKYNDKRYKREHGRIYSYGAFQLVSHKTITWYSPATFGQFADYEGQLDRVRPQLFSVTKETPKRFIITYENNIPEVEFLIVQINYKAKSGELKCEEFFSDLAMFIEGMQALEEATPQDVKKMVPHVDKSIIKQ